MRLVPKFLPSHLNRAAVNQAAVIALPLAALAVLAARYAPAYATLIAGKTDLIAGKAALVAGKIDPAAVAIFAPLCVLMLAIVGLVLSMMLRGTAPEADAQPHARAIAHWGAENNEG